MKQGTKNILLLLFFVLLLFLAYQYSFTKTFELKAKLEQLHLQNSPNLQSETNQYDLNERELFLDSIINKNFSGSSLQNDLLEVLNKNSKDKSFKIISLNEPHLYISEDNSETTSYRFVLEGNYQDLEKVLYTLEKVYSFGNLAHINFEKKKDYRLNKEFLVCSVLLQNVR